MFQRINSLTLTLSALFIVVSTELIFSRENLLSFLNFSKNEQNEDVFFTHQDLIGGPTEEKCYWHVCIGKVCVCKEGYEKNPNSGKCEECWCGVKAIRCSFTRHGKKCDCGPGDVQKNGVCMWTCKSDGDCLNGGRCKGDICECKSGVSGDRCDVINACQSQLKNCKSPGGRCRYDTTKNQAVCECNQGYLLDDNTCKECWCESGGTCTFEQGSKVCKCKSGYSIKPDTGRCEKCNCGQYGENCQFLPNGQSRCTCEAGYADDRGLCKKCDCGSGATCTFERGTEVCDCQPGFSKQPSTGLCKECVCGDGDLQCIFDGSEQRCICSSGYADDSGKCKKCDCGPKALKCLFEGSNKRCSCSTGYVETEGTCKECDCGQGTLACVYVAGQKRCFCATGYVEKDGKCQ